MAVLLVLPTQAHVVAAGIVREYATSTVKIFMSIYIYVYKQRGRLAQP